VRDEPGHLSFVLHGRKLSGRFALTRTGEKRWILVKGRDEDARPGSDIVAEQPASVRSGKTWQEVASQSHTSSGSPGLMLMPGPPSTPGMSASAPGSAGPSSW
jgi:hypothetical protein